MAVVFLLVFLNHYIRLFVDGNIFPMLSLYFFYLTFQIVNLWRHSLYFFRELFILFFTLFFQLYVHLTVLLVGNLTVSETGCFFSGFNWVFFRINYKGSGFFFRSFTWFYWLWILFFFYLTHRFIWLRLATIFYR